LRPRAQLVAQRILGDGAHDGLFARHVSHALGQLGESLHLAEEVAGVELGEHHVALAAAGDQVDVAGDDEREPLRLLAAHQDLLAGLELVELGERLEAVAVARIEAGEALAVAERRHGGFTLAVLGVGVAGIGRR
jgi:hypothetical protein